MYRLPLAISLQKTDNLIETLETEFELGPREVARASKLVSSDLPPLVRPEIISFMFGISYSLLLSMSRNPEYYYRTYKIKKYGGGTRQIEAPRRFLKLVQRWIYDYILSGVNLPMSVHGFVPGKDIFSNARVHLDSRNIMVVDIQDFFPSIGSKSVRHVFSELHFPVKVANRLTGLSTFRDRLPQGAPTSPALANIIFSPVDVYLIHLAEEWECNYTRYADDLIFSGDRVFSKGDTAQISKILGESGFTINTKKTRIIGSGARQMITGLVANQKGFPPREKRMEWRAMFNQAKLNPVKYKGEGSRLAGIAAFVNMYDKALAQEYKQIAKKIMELDSR